MKLFVIPGHGAGDPGACGNGYSEAERVRALATRIKALGGASVTLADFSRNYYEDNGISRLNLPSGTQIVELHMDSDKSAAARGGHVIIQAGIGGADKYDKALAKSISAIFPGRAVVIDERDDLQNPAQAAAKGYGYRLVENGFISNAQDVKVFNSRLDDIARAYLAAFGIKEGQVAFTDGTYVTNVNLNVRDKRAKTGTLVCVVAKGAKLKLDSFAVNSAGNTWARIASGDHKGRFVCVRNKSCDNIKG